MFWWLYTATKTLSYTSCPRSLGNSVYLKHPSLEIRSDEMAASISLCSFFMVFKACHVLGPKMHNYLIKSYLVLTCQTKLWLISINTALERVQPVGLILLFCKEVILNNNIFFKSWSTSKFQKVQVLNKKELATTRFCSTKNILLL